MAAKVTASHMGVPARRHEAPAASGSTEPAGRRALVITVSDGVAAGVRRDLSGDGLARRLEGLGFAVDRAKVPDERSDIEHLLAAQAASHVLILTTGGTGLTPRDVTPQATRATVEYEVPGLPELMRAQGGRSTPNAYLSRSVAGVLKQCLVVNLPGSPRGAMDSLAALELVLDHALATLAGPFDHDLGTGDGSDGSAAAGRPNSTNS
jgi:molybdenum cofactor biosynthesis protein B